MYFLVKLPIEKNDWCPYHEGLNYLNGPPCSVVVRLLLRCLEWVIVYIGMTVNYLKLSSKSQQQYALAFQVDFFECLKVHFEV